MSGFFPSVPTLMNFDLAYAAVNGQWRLFGISVALGSSAPVAPSAQPVAAHTAAEKPPPAHKPLPKPATESKQSPKP
jgi:hypothetical protein